MDHLQLHRRLAADLSTAMIYALLRLRLAVFAVEHGCRYQDLDGHDLHQTTRHYWLAPYGAIEDAQATLRMREPDEGRFRIDRVCAAPPARAQGGVRRLLEAALAEVGAAPCLLEAQPDLVAFYVEFGFVVDETGRTDNNVPMHREGSARVR
ncbi:MAG: GNAT family N-acetyltransferase [Pseudonocardiaceae bacterium]